MGDIIFHLTDEERHTLTVPATTLEAEAQKRYLAQLARMNAHGFRPDEERSTDGYGLQDGGKQ